MSIQNNDLIDLIQSTFSVDQYKSKIGDDKNVVVLAFEVKDADPAKDLSQFIETGHNTIDVDVSPGPNKDGNYKVFVELERNSKLFDSIDNFIMALVDAWDIKSKWGVCPFTTQPRAINPSNFLKFLDIVTGISKTPGTLIILILAFDGKEFFADFKRPIDISL